MTGLWRGSYSWLPEAGFDRKTLFVATLLYVIITWLPLTLPLVGGTGVFSAAASGLKAFLIGRSMALAFCSASLAVLLGLPPGISLWNRDGYFFRWRWLILMFLLLPPYLLAQGWLAVSSVTSFLSAPSGFWWAVIILGTAYAPIAALIVASARSSLDGAPLQSSALVSGPSGMMRLVVIPQLKPFLAAAWLLVAVIVLLEGGVPLSLQLPVLATELTSRFMGGETPGDLALRLWPLYLMVLPGGITAYRLLVSGVRSVEGDSESRLLQPQNFPVPVRFCLWCGGLLFSLLAAMPLSGLVYQAIYGASSKMAFSSDWAAMLQSLWLAVIVALLSALIALPVGAWMALGGRRSLRIVLLLPTIVPASLTGIAWTYWGVRLGSACPWLPDSVPMILGHLARALPLAVLVAIAAWNTSSGLRARESVLLYHRHFWQKLQLDLPRIFLLSVVAGVFSLRELEVALLTVPPGGETLPLRVFNLLHYGAGADVCRLSMLLVLPIAGAAWFVSRRWRA